MKLSLDWLSDFVTFTEKDPEEIAKAITAHTAEVDGVEVQGALLAFAVTITLFLKQVKNCFMKCEVCKP